MSLQLDFETVYEVGQAADTWIARGSTNSISEIEMVDNRFANFKSLQNSEFYNFNKRVNEIGIFDYYESAVVKPEIILADLIKIFHPILLPEHELYYFQKLD